MDVEWSRSCYVPSLDCSVNILESGSDGSIKAYNVPDVLFDFLSNALEDCRLTLVRRLLQVFRISEPAVLSEEFLAREILGIKGAIERRDTKQIRFGELRYITRKRVSPTIIAISVKFCDLAVSEIITSFKDRVVLVHGMQSYTKSLGHAPGIK